MSNESQDEEGSQASEIAPSPTETKSAAVEKELVAIQAVMQHWKGQLPPPEAAERFEALQPGTLDRLLTMNEKSLQATIDGTSEARKLLQKDTRRGQVLGFIATLASIAGAILCAYLNQPLVASALVAVPVMSVAMALISSAKGSSGDDNSAE